eukprot:8161637-Pyramimonas_sp.AAC.1
MSVRTTAVWTLYRRLRKFTYPGGTPWRCSAAHKLSCSTVVEGCGGGFVEGCGGGLGCGGLWSWLWRVVVVL